MNKYQIIVKGKNFSFSLEGGLQPKWKMQWKIPVAVIGGAIIRFCFYVLVFYFSIMRSLFPVIFMSPLSISDRKNLSNYRITRLLTHGKYTYPRYCMVKINNLSVLRTNPEEFAPLPSANWIGSHQQLYIRLLGS